MADETLKGAVEVSGVEVHRAPGLTVDERIHRVGTKTRALEAGIDLDAGVKTPEAFARAYLAGNEKAREDGDSYARNALSLALYGHNGELPHALILTECSDGRNGGPEMFSRDPRIRFTTYWRPEAGLILSPRLLGALKTPDPDAALQAILADDEQRRELFDDLEQLYGRQIRKQLKRSEATVVAARRLLLGQEPPDGTSASVLRKADTMAAYSGETLVAQAARNPRLAEKVAALGRRYPVTIEQQSHSDPHNACHGCGAHASDLGSALNMTALNALALEAFVRERYPDDADDIRISLTHHFTGADEKVVDVYRPDLQDKLHPALRERIAGDRFRPAFQRSREDGIVRAGKINPLQINQHEHDEYVVRVSEHHKANGLPNTSVLEQSMLPDPALMDTIVLKLVSIAQSHRVAADAELGLEQPIFLHLDEPVDDLVTAERYQQLHERLLGNPVISELIAAKKLFIVRSQTQSFSLTKPDRLQTRFFS